MSPKLCSHTAGDCVFESLSAFRRTPENSGEHWRAGPPHARQDWQIPALLVGRFRLSLTPISFCGFDKSYLEDEVAQLPNWHPVIPGLYGESHEIIHTQVEHKISPTFPIQYYLGS